MILMVFASHNTVAAPNYQTGEITNLSSVQRGVLIIMDNNNLPDNCQGTTYGWMLIDKEDPAIISVVLAAWASGNTAGTVYTSGIATGDNVCRIIQFHPTPGQNQ